MMKKFAVYTLSAIFMFISGAVYGQTPLITTADEFLEFVAQTYGDIRDYTADISITKDQTETNGVISYLAPHNLRIDFSVPEKQVLVSDGDSLWIYLPSQEIVLQQSMRASSSSGIGIANSAGLSLLKSNYSASFLSSPAPTLISGTNERGVHLKLVWNSSTEHFKEIIMAINDSGYIRMISGTTVRDEIIRFDFTNIKINQGVPAARFDYDPPASASLYADFLFDR